MLDKLKTLLDKHGVEQALKLVPDWARLPIIYVIGYLTFRPAFIGFVGIYVPISASTGWSLDSAYAVFGLVHSIGHVLRSKISCFQKSRRSIALAGLAAAVAFVTTIHFRGPVVEFSDETLQVRGQAIAERIQAVLVDQIEAKKKEFEKFLKLIDSKQASSYELLFVTTDLEWKNPIANINLSRGSRIIKQIVKAAAQAGIENASLLWTEELGHVVCTSVKKNGAILIGAQPYSEADFLNVAVKQLRPGEDVSLLIDQGDTRFITYSTEIDDYGNTLSRRSVSLISPNVISEVHTKLRASYYYEQPISGITTLNSVFVRTRLNIQRDLNLKDLAIQAVLFLLFMFSTFVFVALKSSEVVSKAQQSTPRPNDG